MKNKKKSLIFSYISLIDQVFDDMRKKNKKKAKIVVNPSFPITRLSGGILQTEYIQIQFTTYNQNNIISIVYYDDIFDIFSFNSSQEKIFAIKFLIKNNILPPEEKLLGLITPSKFCYIYYIYHKKNKKICIAN